MWHTQVWVTQGDGLVAVGGAAWPGWVQHAPGIGGLKVVHLKCLLKTHTVEKGGSSQVQMQKASGTSVKKKELLRTRDYLKMG